MLVQIAPAIPATSSDDACRPRGSSRQPRRSARTWARHLAARRLEISGHITNVSHTSSGVLFETSLQQACNGRRRGRGKRRKVGLALQDRCNRVRDRLPRECDAAGQHFVHHAAKRPDVSPLVDRFPARLFGTHIGRSPEHGALARVTPRHRGRLREARCRSVTRRGLREPEVQYLDNAVRRDLDVGRFEISVNDPLLMCRVKGTRDLSRDGQRIGHRNGPARDAIGQRLALDQFQHERRGRHLPLRGRKSRRCGGDLVRRARALRVET